MMINLVLILPIIFCIISFIFKNKFLNNLLLVTYAILHLLLGIVSIFDLSLAGNNQYFSLNNSNYIFYIVLSIVFMAVSVYNIGYSKLLAEEFSDKKMSHYSIMLIIFVLSMTGGILSNNLGLAWIFIEGTTLASAYLIYFNKTKHSIEAAWKYVFICSIGIALAFVGIILLTISTGSLNSLNYTDLLSHAKEFNPFWLKISFVFIMFGLGTKMGLAPVHFWLPDAHSESPSPISALLSATLLNCAFLVILNVYRIMVVANCSKAAAIMLIFMGFLSLFVTSVFMYHTKNYKRMLAYSSIENMGILAIATALGGVAHYALFLHLIGHSLFKASFFLTSGNILELYGSKKIKSIKSLGQVDRKTSWLWIGSFLGICAFPPSILFISEFMIVRTFILNHNYILCLLFLALLTIILYGMSKVIIEMVYSNKTTERVEKAKNNVTKLSWTMYVPQIVLLFIAFLLGIYMPKILNILITNTLIG